MGEPSKVIGGLLRGYAENRHFQAVADDFGHFSEGHAFFSDTVIVSSCVPLFQSKSKQMGSIKPMHCGPSVEPFT
jgi:hypothetical protein